MLVMKENKRSLITENLKNWYLIDSVLLNGHAKHVFESGKDFQEWITIKSAMLQNLFEYYSYIKYNPKMKEMANSKVLQEAAVFEAKRAKSTASRMMMTDKFKQHIKSYISESLEQRPVRDVRTFRDKVITERFLRMSLDNALIGVPLLESGITDTGKDVKIVVLEESYRLMRNSLIHLSKTAKRAKK